MMPRPTNWYPANPARSGKSDFRPQREWRFPRAFFHKFRGSWPFQKITDSGKKSVKKVFKTASRTPSGTTIFPFSAQNRSISGPKLDTTHANSPVITPTCPNDFGIMQLPSAQSADIWPVFRDENRADSRLFYSGSTTWFIVKPRRGGFAQRSEDISRHMIAITSAVEYRKSALRFAKPPRRGFTISLSTQGTHHAPRDHSPRPQDQGGG